MTPERLFLKTVEADFFRLFCGEKIGEGAFREVWSCATDDTLVVKIESVSQSFCNVYEWDLWSEADAQGWGAKEWMAPCVQISPCGTVLLQKRTVPAKKFPEKIPAWLADTKRQNFGIYKGRFVAHDYGNHAAYRVGMRSNRLVSANWWE